MLVMMPSSLAPSVRSRNSPAVARRVLPTSIDVCMLREWKTMARKAHHQRRGEGKMGGHTLGMWTPLRYVLSSCGVRGTARQPLGGPLGHDVRCCYGVGSAGSCR